MRILPVGTREQVREWAIATLGALIILSVIFGALWYFDPTDDPAFADVMWHYRAR